MEPIRGFFADSAAAARGEGEYDALRAERTAAEGAPKAPAVAASVEGAQERTFGAPGAASASIASRGITATPFNAADLTEAQREAAGNRYRDAWQREAPGGLRNAGAGGVDLYNAEQQVRGTGITAQRQGGGTMSFSGNGADALPQNYTQGVDLNLGNERMARANAIRQNYLDSQAGANGGPKGGAIGGGGDAAVREKLVRELTTVAPGARGITAAQRAGMASLWQEQARGVNAAADLGLRQQQLDQSASTDAARVGIEQQRAAGETEARGFQTRAARRMEELQQQYDKAAPEDRASIAEQIRVFLGKDREQSNRFTVVPGGQEVTEQGMRTVLSRVLNNQTGQFVEQPAQGQFQEGKTYIDANGNRAIWRNGKWEEA